MSGVITEHIRRAAHGKHRCGRCGEPIAARERYRDARIADNGTAWTCREHLSCTAYVTAFGLEDDESCERGEVLAWEAEGRA